MGEPKLRMFWLYYKQDTCTSETYLITGKPIVKQDIVENVNISLEEEFSQVATHPQYTLLGKKSFPFVFDIHTECVWNKLAHPQSPSKKIKQ